MPRRRQEGSGSIEFLAKSSINSLARRSKGLPARAAPRRPGGSIRYLCVRTGVDLDQAIPGDRKNLRAIRKSPDLFDGEMRSEAVFPIDSDFQRQSPPRRPADLGRGGGRERQLPPPPPPIPAPRSLPPPHPLRTPLVS